LLLDDREGLVGEVLGEQGEQGAAQQSEVGEGVGIAGAGSILAPEDVALPVIADFDAGPMAADKRLPLGWGALVGFCAGEIKAGFESGFGGLFFGALTAHDDQAAGEGEVGFEGLEGEGVQAAIFDPAVAAAELEKKGVPGRASKASA